MITKRRPQTNSEPNDTDLGSDIPVVHRFFSLCYLFVTSGDYLVTYREGQMTTLPETQFQKISREKRKDSMFVLLGIIALAWIIVFIIS